MKLIKKSKSIVDRIKDKTNYYRAALPKVVSAYGKKLIGEKASTEEEEFRKSQCETCLLFTGTNCNKNAVSNNKEIIPLEDAERIGIVTKDEYNNTRTVVINGDTYYRGCGCSLTGSNAKWKFNFSNEELNKLDGTAPCPMGKWSINNFNKWKNELSK